MSETILHSFDGTDGAFPYSSVVCHDNFLYGTTSYGGDNNKGTLFSFDLTLEILTTLYSLTDQQSDVSIIYQNGILYGTTSSGGESNFGTLFGYDLSSGILTTLYSFLGIPTEGSHPLAPLIYQSGILYGITSNGGASDFGTLYSFNLDLGILTTLHSFAGTPTEGSFPFASVININGKLYGTTDSGGTTNYGTLFCFDLDLGILTTLHSFTQTDGSYPDYSVVYQDGLLYGTTSYGGDNNKGTLFIYNLSSGILTTLHSFFGTPTEGSYPFASVIYIDGALYGTTESGGTNNNGTLYGFDLSLGILTTLHSFVGTPTDGSLPNASLIYYNGLLYGNTSSGGINDSGTLFSFTLPIPIPVFDTCFPVGTPIFCDQGNISIDKINPLKHTINRQTITAITKTISQDAYLICFEKNALGYDCPNQRTIISKNHKILFRGKMVEAYKFLGHFKNVKKVEYNQQILYNVLMEKHETINVNNLVCETLHPNNMIAKLHNRHFEEKEKNEIIRIMNESIHKKDRISFAKVAMRIND